VHVVIDTYSGFVFASPRSGEATGHVIDDCLAAFAEIGKPLHIKSDNGPGYTSTTFKAFVPPTNFSYHRHALQSTRPTYSETSAPKFKVQLQRQEGGDSSPATQINQALFTLNFLNCSESGFTPAEKHWEHSNKQHLPQELWKDVMTGAWQGPSPVLLWGRGHACAFP
jgi:hypothetical protein